MSLSKIIFLSIFYSVVLNNWIFAQNYKPINDSILKKIYYKKATEFKKIHKKDSAYFYYNKTLNTVAKTDSIIPYLYYNIAVIDYYNYDLVACESNCIKALKNNNGSHLSKKYVYNLLGLTTRAKGDYNGSLTYYKKYQKEYRKKKDTLKSFITYHNNMGNIYKQMKLYNKAIIHFDSILTNPEIKKKHLKKYARTLDNKAYTLLISGQHTPEVLQQLQQALQLKKTFNNKAGEVISYLHLAVFYKKTNQKEAEKKAADSALRLSQKLNLPYNKLEALSYLIDTDINPNKKYFQQYKKIQDSIIDKERINKDQAAKMRYNFFEQQKKIQKQKRDIIVKNKRNKWLAGFLFFSLMAMGIFIWQNRKINRQNGLLEEKNVQLKQQNKFIEVLHQEMHHRIKNNFRIVNIFIKELKQTIKDAKIENALSDIQKRIDALMKVHMDLQQTSISENTKLKDYINLLIQGIANSFDKQNVITTNNIAENFSIKSIDKFRIGLIINEFITNSYKYAFDETEKPHILIASKETTTHYTLILKDNGKGLSKDFNNANLSSIGLKLIDILSLQLGGKYTIDGTNGMQIKITFPKKID